MSSFAFSAGTTSMAWSTGPSPRYCGSVSTVTDAVTVTPVADAELFGPVIATDEAEEGHIVCAADHAEAAGHERACRNILAAVDLREKTDGLAVVLLRLAGRVDVPETVVLRLDVDDVGVDVERERHIARVVLGIAVEIVQIDGRARVHRLDVLLVEHLLERVRAAVENDHVGGGDVLEHLRADVIRVDLEGGRVDRRDDLVQLPARGNACISDSSFHIPLYSTMMRSGLYFCSMRLRMFGVRRSSDSIGTSAVP